MEYDRRLLERRKGGRGEEGRRQTSGDRDKKEKKSKTQKETKRRGDDYGGRDPPCI